MAGQRRRLSPAQLLFLHPALVGREQEQPLAAERPQRAATVQRGDGKRQRRVGQPLAVLGEERVELGVAVVAARRRLRRPRQLQLVEARALGAAHRDPPLVERALVDEKEIFGQAVEKVVGQHHHRRLAAGGQATAALQEHQLPGPLGVEAREVELARLDERPQLRVAAPRLHRRRDEVAHHVD